MSKPWKVGDACRLVDLRIGKVYAARIEAIDPERNTAHVRPDDSPGLLFGVRLDSSFLQRPKPEGETQ